MIQQMNLFNTAPEKSGYRLDYMEIYNWGTFDKKSIASAPRDATHCSPEPMLRAKARLSMHCSPYWYRLKESVSTTSHPVQKKKVPAQKNPTS